jgi:hypothetical protein
VVDEIRRRSVGGAAFQSCVFGGRDQDGGTLAAFGHHLRFAVSGALDQFAEFVLGVLQSPYALVRGEFLAR